MQFYGKAEESAKRIVSLFETGDVPKALAPIFIHRKDDCPCRAWSWSNQLLVALAGFDDARGFRQWQSVGRYVRKGQHGFPILCPVTKKIPKTDPETGEKADGFAVVEFKAQTVFGYEQTDGQPMPEREKRTKFVRNLPLADVAERWGLDVSTFNARKGGALGWYRHGVQIALGVENLATWAHELIHAADDRLGNLGTVKPKKGEFWRCEVVAELGGSILLDVMGFEREADKGGAWEYISAYAQHGGISPIVACQRVLKRTCDCVALILAEYEAIQAGKRGAA